ncbi:restriction endonuclease [Pectobacterium peruviense]|uniref:Restriction endonuclease n=1 Tax=Pectobacterium peruviense TaxID=2066479 RepID=A0ABX4SAG6_9GAMM|nr:restriction endonuclease [Pectobacterium peruviense]KML70015.1 restriction endonuclease [Pectobacterium peruviense]PKX82779.1 restriction endonuclease [Pectobacterium peruviense]PKX87041.1 restriction endonuclease [Pectobacterium peruviense]
MIPQRPYLAEIAEPVLGIVPILFFILTVAAISMLFRWRGKASVRRHRRYRKTAERLLKRLPTLAGDAQRFSYLRRVNPYVFEEILLLAMERQGLKVIRNASYSGNGGLDGQVFIKGQRWLIQAKRYSRAIDPAHVEAFSVLLIQHRCCGLFIHTGRTGAKSKQHASSSHNNTFPLYIISGQQLLALLAGNPNWINLEGSEYESIY